MPQSTQSFSYLFFFSRIQIRRRISLLYDFDSKIIQTNFGAAWLLRARAQRPGGQRKTRCGFSPSVGHIKRSTVAKLQVRVRQCVCMDDDAGKKIMNKRKPVHKKPDK